MQWTNNNRAEELSGLQFCDSIFLTFSIRFYKSFNGVRVAVVAFEVPCVTYGLSGSGLHLIPALTLGHHIITVSLALSLSLTV